MSVGILVEKRRIYRVGAICELFPRVVGQFRGTRVAFMWDGTRRNNMSYKTREEFLFPLQKLARTSRDTMATTYRTQSNNLSGKLPPKIHGNAIKVEHKLGKRFPIMPLPLPDGIQGLRRGLLVSGTLHLGLFLFIPRRDQLLLERTGLGITGPSREQLRIRVVSSGL